MIQILQDLANEIDFLTAIGPVEYIKDKVSDIGWAIKYALGEDEDENGDNDNDRDISVNEVTTGVNEDELAQEANDFINDHMLELREVIAKTVKGVNPSGYTDQQSYLEDVFGLAGEACWSYIQDIFNDPAINPELSAKITETMIKDTAVVVAMTMFIEWALIKKSDGNDDNETNEEEVKV